MWQRLKRRENERIMQIDASTILITGGSSGLGAACAEMLARRGAGVVVAELIAAEECGARGDFRSCAVCTDGRYQ